MTRSVAVIFELAVSIYMFIIVNTFMFLSHFDLHSSISLLDLGYVYILSISIHQSHQGKRKCTMLTVLF